MTIASRPARLPIGGRQVTAKAGSVLGASLAAKLWRDLAGSVGYARLARTIGLSESTVYKQGELVADLMPGERAQTVRTNPVQAVADSLVLAISTGHGQEATAIVRALCGAIGFRAIPEHVTGVDDPIGAALEVVDLAADAARLLHEAGLPGSESGTDLGESEAEEIERHLQPAADRIHALLLDCKRARLPKIDERSRQKAEAATVRATGIREVG